jgi:hypothetical protein
MGSICTDLFEAKGLHKRLAFAGPGTPGIAQMETRDF